MDEDEVGSADIHCLDCGLSAGVKLSDLPAWKLIGCPNCGEGVNAEVDLGSGVGSIDTAIHNDDGSITCTICDSQIGTRWQTIDGNTFGTIMRAGTCPIEDCPSCKRAFDRMKKDGVIRDES